MRGDIFRFADRMEAAIMGNRWKSTGPDYLGESDIASFETATRARRVPKNKEEILLHLKQKNPVRMYRMKRDFRWMQRQMKKMGLNPEDARELL